jgi:hypothetical protein
MKKLTVFLILALLLVGVTAAVASDFEFPYTTTIGVEPVTVPNLGVGDAAHYCVTTLDYDFGIKIQAWPSVGGNYDGAYDGKGSIHEDHKNTITITNSTRTFFDWSSMKPIFAVVVQGGPKDNIFYYDRLDFEPVWGDTDLYADPRFKKVGSGDQEVLMSNISHASFCWKEIDDNGDEKCYQDETAWADGERYVEQGNWATYTPYEPDSSVILYAGQTMEAGEAYFSEPVDGEVTITITLNEGWIFYYDLYDPEEDHNLKVQDYAEAPSGNPAPGLFDWKTFIPVGSTTGNIVVPANNFYGVHLDLAQLVSCE